MRLRREGQRLGLRLQEAELAQLLAGATLTHETCWPDGVRTCEALRAGEAAGWARCADGWDLALPRAALAALAARLPSREGVTAALPVPGAAPLVVTLDVDLRDPARRRRGRA